MSMFSKTMRWKIEIGWNNAATTYTVIVDADSVSGAIAALDTWAKGLGLGCYIVARVELVHNLISLVERAA